MTVLDFQRIGLDDDPPALVDYRWAWDEQRRVHAEVVAGTRTGVVKRQYWVRRGTQWKIFFEGVLG